MDITGEQLFALGVVLVVFWILLLVASEIIQHSWAWIDDEEASRYNFIVKILTRMLGYKGDEWSCPDGGVVVCITSCVLLFTPMAIAFSIAIYPVVLSIVVMVILAHVARFAKRHKKLFDKHIGDKSAHN